MKKDQKQLDDLWAKAIKQRDKQCWRCASTADLQAHHIISKRHKATRWLPKNGMTLCRKHHLYWWHSKDPKTGVEVWEWFKSRWGWPGFPIKDEDDYNKLTIQSRETWDKDTLRWKILLETLVE